MRRRTGLALGVAVAALLLVASACAREAGTGLEPAERTIYMSAVEPKGSTTADKEPFPTAELPAGGGYKLEQPDDEGAWTASTYRWLPNDVVVVQGDEVTLEIFGVNGESHPSTIEGYGIDFEVKRGQLTTVEFTAEKPGIFRIVCHVHQPSMAGNLIVLPA